MEKIHYAMNDTLLLNAVLYDSVLYHWNVDSSVYPVEGIDMLGVILERVAKRLENYLPLVPGIKLKVRVKASSYGYLPGIEEDCFNFY